ncbi:unnamed protein product [Gongylonema pulchrum]|uniref:Transposase n=1 Tax=Gongylonema pulchrum TaxID=637853 RepID=A0A183F1A0_9BILA|nr:unnamed protein product [Gongylonema pulchrum]
MPVLRFSRLQMSTRYSRWLQDARGGRAAVSDEKRSSPTSQAAVSRALHVCGKVIAQYGAASKPRRSGLAAARPPANSSSASDATSRQVAVVEQCESHARPPLI